MPEWLTWKRVAATVLVLGPLAGTHGLAYWLGMRRQFEKTAAFVKSLSDGYEQDALRIRVEALRIMANHAHQLPPEEVRGFCKRTESLADYVESATVAPARKAENDPLADRWQREVDEARRLTAQLKGKLR